MNEENMIQTPYGIFNGVVSIGYFPDGAVKELRLEEKNMIVTHVGDLVPYYGEDTPRRKYKASVTFYKNGMVRSVSLEQQQEVMTPIGELPAELVTFYETGELKRVFPLDGKISGFWSEEDERGLNIPIRFEFDFASFSAMLNGICFFPGGDIKSVSLFPGEVIQVTAPAIGTLNVRNGFSLYESGTLHSVEPAVPVPVATPIGTISAYDTDAHGIHADSNSLRFDEAGKLMGLVTSSDKIAVHTRDGGMHFFAPAEIEDPEDSHAKLTVPLAIEFDNQARTVSFTDAQGETARFSLDESFLVYPGALSGCSPQDCASCSLCSH